MQWLWNTAYYASCSAVGLHRLRHDGRLHIRQVRAFLVADRFRHHPRLDHGPGYRAWQYPLYLLMSQSD